MNSLILVYTLFLIGGVIGEGCLELDMFSFDKIVSKFDAAMIYYDVHPFHQKHAMLKAICQDFEFPSNLLVAQVRVEEGDEKRDEDLANRNSVMKYPSVILYIEGKDPIEFKPTKDFPFNPINLRNKHTKIYIPLPGCIQEFDHLVKRFPQLEDDEKKRILSQAESMEKKLETQKEKKSANTYIKIMKKILENGTSILDYEVTRINKLLRENVGMRQRTEFHRTLNVIHSFQNHDEL